MTTKTPSDADRRRWARYLAEERAEGDVYRNLAMRRSGEQRRVLLQLAAAEKRHEAHWLQLLGAEPERLPRPGFRTRVLSALASKFGSIFVLVLAQSREERSPYDGDADATAAMAADERVHQEVVRGLAAEGRRSLAGSFRAAVFGANDGLVSNLALVLGIGATGVAPGFVLFSGIAGLLSGALSMGAGEFVSVKSQRELLAATAATTTEVADLRALDLNENELSLVFRARGDDAAQAQRKARELLSLAHGQTDEVNLALEQHQPVSHSDADEIVGTAWSAAISSFLFFATGAVIPVLPWIFGLSGTTAVVVALVLVGISLMLTGAAVGVLSGTSPLTRALRQLAIGFGAAAVTYTLGLLFGANVA